MDSILITIKKGLGILDNFDGFDTEIIIAINNAIFTLYQLGVGPGDFKVTGISETWEDLLDSVTDIESVKSYILSKVRLEFDPPTSSYMIESINRRVEELTWRLMVQVDPPIPPEEEEV